MNVGILTHLDLDAVGTAIVAHNVFGDDVVGTRRCNYPQIDETMDKLLRDGADTLYVGDICFTPKQLLRALKEFKHVFYFDHHEGSLKINDMLESMPKKPKNLTYSIGLDSAAMLSWRFFATSPEYHGTRTDDRHLFMSQKMQKLILLINTYDTWKIKNPQWEEAYNLNIVFWKHGYSNFLDRFYRGFDRFTTEENDWLKKYYDTRKKVMDEAFENRIELDSGSVIFVCLDKNYINDFSLQFPDYKIYYMVRSTGRNFACSVRIHKGSKWSNGNIDLNHCINEAWQRGFISPDTVTSCGGHKESAAIDFAKHATYDDVLMMIDAVEQQVEKYEAIRKEGTATTA